jgi:hypothetical protein
MYVSRLAYWCQYIEEHCIFHPPFNSPPVQGQKCWVSDFFLLFGGPSISVPNFSFLPRLEVG